MEVIEDSMKKKLLTIALAIVMLFAVGMAFTACLFPLYQINTDCRDCESMPCECQMGYIIRQDEIDIVEGQIAVLQEEYNELQEEIEYLLEQATEEIIDFYTGMRWVRFPNTCATLDPIHGLIDRQTHILIEIHHLQRRIVWLEGNFFRLYEAYERNWLSTGDLKNIAYHYQGSVWYRGRTVNFTPSPIETISAEVEARIRQHFIEVHMMDTNYDTISSRVSYYGTYNGLIIVRVDAFLYLTVVTHEYAGGVRFTHAHSGPVFYAYRMRANQPQTQDVFEGKEEADLVARYELEIWAYLWNDYQPMIAKPLRTNHFVAIKSPQLANIAPEDIAMVVRILSSGATVIRELTFFQGAPIGWYDFRATEIFRLISGADYTNYVTFSIGDYMQTVRLTGEVEITH